MNKTKTFPAKQKKANKTKVSELEVEENLNELLKKENITITNSAKKDQHNDHQQKFVTSVFEDAKLMGIPGGGKTRTIIERIIYLNKNSIIKSSDNVLVLTFSRKARDDFYTKAIEKNSDIFDNSNIRTIHSMSGTIVTSLLGRQTKSIETVVLAAVNLLETMTDDELHSIDEIANLKIVFVDESQDISELYYRFLQHLKKRLDVKVVMVGDPNQNIYQFKNGSDKHLLEHKGTSYYLVDNYRSTKEIVKFINYFRPWKKMIPEMKSVNGSGKKPEIYINNVFAIKHDIVHELKNYKGDLKDVAIIGPVKYAKFDKATNSYKSIGLQLVANWLEVAGIKFIRHYGLSDDYDSGDSIQEYKSGHVNLLTIHACKGLEFDKVIILNFHHQTFSKNPTEEDYNMFEYLWYVALSRAKRDLKIYVDINKKIFKKFVGCPNSLYTINKPVIDKNFPLDSVRRSLIMSVTDIINDKKLFSEEVFSYIENSFNIDYVEEKMYSVDKTHNYADNIFLGIFFEYVYAYYFLKYSKKGGLDTFILKYMTYINSIIDLPIEHTFTIKRLGLGQLFKTFTLCDLEPFKHLSKETKDLYEYIGEKINYDVAKEFSFFFENDIISLNREELLKICDKILEGKSVTRNLFYISKFVYQYNTEAKNLLEHIDNTMFDDLKYWIKKIKQYCKKNSECEEAEFHKDLKHFYLNLVGEADLVVDSTVIELKFTKSITEKHVIQTLLYYIMTHPRWDSEVNFTIINMYTGHKRDYTLTPKIGNFELILYLSKITGLTINSPIIMYDLETTGLDIDKTEIIEAHFQDFVTNSVVLSSLIRPQQAVPKEIEEITHITNKMLEDEKDIHDFKKKFADIMKQCHDPVFIAHNGTVFDHKIMRKKEMITCDNRLLLDSKLIIRFFTEHDTFKKRLGDIYLTVIGEEPVDAHRAYADVVMMVKIFDKLNINPKQIMSLI